MAFERATMDAAKIKGEGLDAFIAGLSNMYLTQIAVKNAQDEYGFLKAVVDNNISLDDQLIYRKQQLMGTAGDAKEKKRISTEIQTLKQRIEANKYSDEYLTKLADSNAGITTLDSIIDWMKNQMAIAQDSDLKLQISQQIATKEGERFTVIQNTLNNQTKYAVEDKTDSIIDAQTSKLNTARSKALLDGNDMLVSLYDLQLQSLNKAKTEHVIDNDIRSFATATMTGYSSAIKLLDAYNNKIASSSAQSGPVTVGDTTYASAQDFWTYRRDSYIADTDSNGFFSRFNSERNTDLKVKSSQNFLTTQDISTAAGAYDALSARPELANYSWSINSYRQDSVQTGANLIGNKVKAQYGVDYDITKALGQLNTIKTLGANVDSIYYDVLNLGASVKKTQVDNILQAMNIAFMKNPEMTPEQALTEAMKSGAAGALSPEQLVTKPAEQIVQEGRVAVSKGAFPEDMRTTIQPGTTPAPTNVPPVVPTQPSTTPAATPPTTPVAITKQLDFGMTDAQVKELQKFLNTHGFQLASTGVGSPGNETNYFGPLTQAALQKFQAAQGIVSQGNATTTGYGRVGPRTLTKIQQMYGGI